MKKLVIILSGGIGERARPITLFLNKGLIPINGKPILSRLIEQYLENGFDNFLILTGYLSKQVKKVLTAQFPKIELHIKPTPIEFSPAQRIIDSKDFIEGFDSVIINYCDNLLDDKSMNFILNQKHESFIAVSKSMKGNCVIEENSNSVKYSVERSDKFKFTELGFFKVKAKELLFNLEKTIDLPSSIEQITRQQTVIAIKIDDYSSVSTLERYNSMRKKRFTILLDRDGTIIKSLPKGHYVLNEESIEYIPKNCELFRELSTKYGVDFIVLTNQACVELKLLSEFNLLRIHQLIIEDLILQKIPILSFYHCPHHWESDCKCRKPKIGLVTRAIVEFSLNPSEILMIGDTDSDVLAGTNAGVTSFKISEQMSEKEWIYAAKRIENFVIQKINESVLQ